jgi:alkylation response protein AidB-like acyl-CoA dehydrogenase
MNFELSEERKMLAESLSRFIELRYPFEVRNAIVKSPAGYSADLWREFAGLGIIGALFNPEHGGYGGAAADLAVVFEALGRGLVVEPFLGNAVLAGGAIARLGNASQKQIIAHIIDGSRVAAFAHGEPQARYEIARVATRAERAGDGWKLNGAKAVVQHAEGADLLVVSARTSGAVDAPDGICLFLVPAKTPGLALRGYPLVDGGRAADLTLRDVTLPAAALLGAQGEAFATIEEVVGRGIVALCAESLGAMSVAKEATLAYLRTRKQFGVPIGTFQALQHRMADMLIEIEQMRSAVINAVAALDGERGARERTLSAAKYSCGKIGTLVAEECIQLHGGIGMTWELPLSHYAKRLVMIDHQLGDEDYHLARYIALGRQ